VKYTIILRGTHGEKNPIDRNTTNHPEQSGCKIKGPFDLQNESTGQNNT
jgi:hypothetical protein